MTFGTRARRRTRSNRSPWLAPAWVALALGAGSQPASAQTTEELRAELLQTREELRTALALVESLRAEVSRLTSELREARGEETLEALAEIPADPLACPASLAAELARRYERDLAHLPNASPRDGFDRAAEDWCERMHHELQARRVWLVSLTDVTALPDTRDLSAHMRVYDEVVLLPLGEPERVIVPARFAARLQAEASVGLWSLTVEVGAEPSYNPSRATRGAFDEPPFVGPFVESRYHLDWIGLAPTQLVPAQGESGGPEGQPLPEPPPPGPER